MINDNLGSERLSGLPSNTQHVNGKIRPGTQLQNSLSLCALYRNPRDYLRIETTWPGFSKKALILNSIPILSVSTLELVRASYKSHWRMWFPFVPGTVQADMACCTSDHFRLWPPDSEIQRVNHSARGRSPPPPSLLPTTKLPSLSAPRLHNSHQTPPREGLPSFPGLPGFWSPSRQEWGKLRTGRAAKPEGVQASRPQLSHLTKHHLKRWQHNWRLCLWKCRSVLACKEEKSMTIEVKDRGK